MSIHRESALQDRITPATEKVTRVHPVLSEAILLRAPNKASSSHGANGSFRFQGQIQIGSQSKCPADVWAYFEERWQGEGGKQWRCWLSRTNQIEYR
jgi:hypothetical protein